MNDRENIKMICSIVRNIANERKDANLFSDLIYLYTKMYTIDNFMVLRLAKYYGLKYDHDEYSIKPIIDIFGLFGNILNTELVIDYNSIYYEFPIPTYFFEKFVERVLLNEKVMNAVLITYAFNMGNLFVQLHRDKIVFNSESPEFCDYEDYKNCGMGKYLGVGCLKNDNLGDPYLMLLKNIRKFIVRELSEVLHLQQRE